MKIGEPKWMKLLAAARQAHRNAYSPYSRFQVGAAILTADGTIFSGCNVENASYGLTICAERNAIFSAAASGARKIVAVAVFTDTDTPTAPCGACRQVIHEFGPDAEVRSFCAGKTVLAHSMKALLPGAFGGESLKI